MSFDSTPRIRGRKGRYLRDRWLSWNPTCAICEAMTPPRYTVATEVDHIVPLFKGGADDDSNRQSACAPCHEAKTARDIGYTPRKHIGIDGFPSENP